MLEFLLGYLGQPEIVGMKDQMRYGRRVVVRGVSQV